MNWDARYRMLVKGEIIQDGDEVEVSNGWKDDSEWRITLCAGEEAPDPMFPAHRRYRRIKAEIHNTEPPK